MGKRLFLFLLLLVMVSFSVSAVSNLTINNTHYYKQDTNGQFEDSIGTQDGIITGATFTSSGKINGAYDLDGTDDYIDLNDSIIDISSESFSISLWYKPENDATNNPVIIGNGNNVNGFYLLYQGGALNTLRFRTSANSDYTGVDLADNTWHHIVITYNQATTTLTAIVNNVSLGTKSTLGTAANDNMIIGKFPSGSTNFLNGLTDEVSIWKNRILTLDDISELYNNGTGLQYPYEEAANATDSVESTAVVKQLGSVVLTGFGMTTVFDSDFNVTVNNTDIYGAYSFNVLSNNNNNLFCELLIDGSVVGNVSRSNQNGLLGSVYIQSSFFTLENGTHNQLLRCQKSSGPGIIAVNNAVGIGHFMRDQNDEIIPHNESIFTGEVSNSTDFVLMDSFNFTISNRTVGGDQALERMFVIEWTANYENNFGSTDILNTFINVTNSTGGNFTPCAFYPRTVEAGGVGSVSGDCLIENLSADELMVVNFYGKGASANFSVDVKVKEFILSDIEIAGGGGFPVNTSFTGKVRLFNISGGNLNHAVTNVFQKVAFSIRSNESTTATFYQTLIDGTNYSTINFTRDINSDIGVLIGHDVIQGVVQDTYQAELWADCGTANCTIVGGDAIGYLTDVTTTITNSFNVSGFDNYDGSVVQSFNVTDGATFTTTTGSLLYFSTQSFENLTASAFNYFDAIFLNHNTSNDLTVNFNQTLIKFFCSEKITGDTITCDNNLESRTFNPNVAGNPHSLTANATGYFSTVFTYSVIALQNNTLNISNFGSTNLTINSSSPLGTVSNCNYTLQGGTFPTYSENVSGTPSGSVSLINGTYNVTADCIGNVTYALLTQQVVINTSVQSFNFTLLTTNSINFTFFEDNDPNTLLSGINISAELFGPEVANFSTNTGFKYLDQLTVGDYEIKYTAPNYDARSYFFTISDRSTENIRLFLSDSNNTVTYIIRVADETDADVVGAVVRLQRQYVSEGGQFVTIEECTTDSSGECDMFIEESSIINYRFIVLVNDQIIKTTPTRNIVALPAVDIKRIVVRVDLGSSIYQSYDNIVGLFSNLTYDNNTDVFTYNFVDSKNQITAGCLRVTRRQGANLSSQVTLYDNCVSGTSGTLTYDATGQVFNGSIIRADGLINFTKSQIIVQSIELDNTQKGANSDDSDDVLITAIILVLVNLAVVLIPSVILQAFVGFVTMFFFAWIGYNRLGTVVVILLLVIKLVFNWTRKNTKDGEPR